jgi:hypothetical protein
MSKEKEMEAKLTYTVETVDRAFGLREGIPWGKARRFEGLTESKAVKTYKEFYRRYHPQPNAYSGHVRIVGSDDWTYTVEPPLPGERATLSRMYHLDDI